MPTITRPSGLVVTVPDTYAVASSKRAIGRSGLSRPTVIPLTSETPETTAEVDPVLQAMQLQDMQLFDHVDLEPTMEATGAGGTRRAGAPAIPQKQQAELALDIADNEHAVVLLQQDGMYSWKFATPEATKGAEPAEHLRGIPEPGRKVQRFSLEITSTRTLGAADAQRGVLKELIYNKVTAYVLTFAAKLAVGEAKKFLERNVHEGIVHMNGLDPADWQPVPDLSTLQLPSDRNPRILLFIHGTFSSTVGSFGALGGTPWGQDFLNGARANYDVLLGFDHSTLAKHPRENAARLLDSLLKINGAPEIDVIAFSRGGLVFRTLTEFLQPTSSLRATFGRAIFVACTNGGTQLAEPKNWHALIDIYTNLAVAACRILGAIPSAKSVTLVLQEVIQSMGALVKYMATDAVTKDGVPGLAAMEPTGEFITELNKTQPGQLEPKQASYYAITSEFAPVILNGDHQPKELPRRLVLALTEGLIRQLMQEDNDLVVNTAAMTVIDPLVGGFIKDEYDFGKTPFVYHTIYFTRPEVANSLTRWLRLSKPQEPAKPVVVTPTTLTTPRTTRGKKRGSRPEVVGIGGVVVPEVPAAADTDILATPSTAHVEDVIAQIHERTPSYIVVQREYEGQHLHYALPAENVLSLFSSPSGTELGRALNLHETDASITHQLGTQRVLRSPGSGSAHRNILLEGNRPVGVIPAQDEVMHWSNEDLVRLASPNLQKAAPEGVLERPRGRSVEEQVLARRLAPSFPNAAAPEATAEPTVTCNFNAQMDEQVILNRATTIRVIVSRELIGAIQGTTSSTGTAKVDPQRNILIQVIPRSQFVVIEEDRCELAPPPPGQPQTLYFDVRPTHTGDGEIWVVARQGQVPLVTLTLKPKIVEQQQQVSARRIEVKVTTSEAPALDKPLHQFLIVEERNGDEVKYFYQLQAPTLKLFGKYYSNPFKGDRQEYVRNLYKEIENKWLTQPGDFDEFTNELRGFGANLFSALFPPDLQAVLWQHQADLKSIMVTSTEPFIPWELVYIKEPGKPVKADQGRFMGEMGLVRWLHEGWPIDVLQVREGRARYVIPDYPLAEYKLAQAALEADFLVENFHATPIEPQPAAVREAISHPGTFDLLHFACHGTAEQDNIVNAQIVLQGRIEGANYIPAYFSATTADAYADLKNGDEGPIVLLNACQLGLSGYKLTGIGGFSEAFVKGGAGLFIGALWSVGDSPARAFSEEFYRRLLAGDDVAEASIRARACAGQAREATWLAYVVYGHPHAKLKRA